MGIQQIVNKRIGQTIGIPDPDSFIQSAGTFSGSGLFIHFFYHMQNNPDDDFDQLTLGLAGIHFLRKMGRDILKFVYHPNRGAFDSFLLGPAVKSG
ncbi:hypothetical protein D3C75_1083620 [compost metagenome]